MKKTVLITGARGFLGRFVAQHFSSIGFNVVGIGHGTWKVDEYRRWGINFWYMGDITVELLVACDVQPDVVVHCAGSGSVSYSMSNPYEDYIRTVASTAAVLEYIRLHSSKTVLVYPSSAAVYGKVSRLPIQETDSLKPISPYGIHKHMAEELCQSYAGNFNISVAIVRFFSLYGNGLQKQLLWDACQKISTGGNQFFGTGTETRDWLHGSDAASLLFEVTKKATSKCPIVNGGSGVGVTVENILSELFKFFERTDSPKFSGHIREGDPTHFIADTSETSGWGWHPVIPLKEGLYNYVSWFKGINH